MPALEDIIKAEITQNGPMDVGRFMALCLGHPDYGYYMTRDPFGVQGDFTTAPEISQMFGEMVGAWVVDVWQKLESPSSFTLLECGAGRGTLMADILRTAKAVPQFLEAVQVVLLETSPVLRVKQKEILSAVSPVWIESLDDLKKAQPLIVVGNEFLDALPIRQFQKSEGQFREKLIGLNEKNELSFGLSDIPSQGAFPLDVKEGEITERAPIREAFMRTLCTRLKAYGGAGLFIDYGYNQRHGDTLQAIKDHQFVSPLDHVGEADLTTHVDFLALRRVCTEEDICEYGIVKQTDFLKALGIVPRAEILKQKATPEQKARIAQDLERLIGLDQMGKLFKVMAFSSERISMAGFSL